MAGWDGIYIVQRWRPTSTKYSMRLCIFEVLINTAKTTLMTATDELNWIIPVKICNKLPSILSANMLV